MRDLANTTNKWTQTKVKSSLEFQDFRGLWKGEKSCVWTWAEIESWSCWSFIKLVYARCTLTAGSEICQGPCTSIIILIVGLSSVLKSKSCILSWEMFDQSLWTRRTTWCNESLHRNEESPKSKKASEKQTGHPKRRPSTAKNLWAIK